MSTVEALKQKATSSNYTYLRLLQKYDFNSDELHYIFEGFEDQSFYFNYIQGISSKYVTYVSKGKWQSIELYHKIDWNKYDKSRVLIFIDRDYSRLLGENIPEDKNIYETTYYSIENYMASSDMLRRLINEIYHFHEDDIIKQIVAKYEIEIARFLELIKPIISWILIVRSHKLKANLNEIDLGKLFTFDGELTLLAHKQNKITYLEKVTQVQTPRVAFSVFKEWYSVIAGLDSFKLYLRGKYELWFLIAFFSKTNYFLLEKHGHNSKVKTNINSSNAIEIIGPRTLIPNNLISFIKQLFP